MKNDRTKGPKTPGKENHDQIPIFSSKAHKLAEKEYEEYYNRIRLLSRGL